MPRHPAHPLLVAGIVAAALACAGCATPTATQSTAPIATPTASPGANPSANPSAQAEPADWWRALDDGTLHPLVTAALIHSPDLAAATARIRQAQALRDSELAQRRPEISAGIEAYRTKEMETRQPAGDGYWYRTPSYLHNRFELAARLRWELDLTGRMGLSAQAAQAELEASQLDAAQARRTLIHELVLAWSDLHLARARLALADEARPLAEHLARSEQRRLAAGLVPRSTLRQAQGHLGHTVSAQADARQLQAQARARLAVLTGLGDRLPTPPELATTHGHAVPGRTTSWSPDAIEQRRDVQAAWLRLLAAEKEGERARLERYPSLTFSADTGLASEILQRWLRGDALVWAIGAALQMPLLDGGRVQARVDGATARRDEQEALYRWTVLRAWQDVRDAQATLEGARTRQAEAESETARLQAEADETRRRVAAGLDTTVAGAQARQASLDARGLLLQRQHDQLIAWAGLQHALGH